jgi:hypothetical protein
MDPAAGAAGHECFKKFFEDQKIFENWSMLEAS